MVAHQTTNIATTRWRRALQTMFRTLSAPTPSETDALSWRDDDSVFQTRDASARAARAMEIEDRRAFSIKENCR